MRDWWATVLRCCGDRVETEQFVTEFEPGQRLRPDVRASPEVGSYRTYDVEVASSSFTAGTQNKTESNAKRRTNLKAEQWSKARRTSCDRVNHRLEKQPLVPMALDVYGRRGKNRPSTDRSSRAKVGRRPLNIDRNIVETGTITADLNHANFPDSVPRAEPGQPRHTYKKMDDPSSLVLGRLPGEGE